VAANFKNQPSQAYLQASVFLFSSSRLKTGSNRASLRVVAAKNGPSQAYLQASVFLFCSSSLKTGSNLACLRAVTKKFKKHGLVVLLYLRAAVFTSCCSRLKVGSYQVSWRATVFCSCSCSRLSGSSLCFCLRLLLETHSVMLTNALTSAFQCFHQHLNLAEFHTSTMTSMELPWQCTHDE